MINGLYDVGDEYKPCSSPAAGEALVDLYGDGSLVMCVPVNTIASLTAGGARVISYGPGTTPQSAPVGQQQPPQESGIARFFSDLKYGTVGGMGGIAIGIVVALLLTRGRR